MHKLLLALCILAFTAPVSAQDGQGTSHGPHQSLSTLAQTLGHDYQAHSTWIWQVEKAALGQDEVMTELSVSAGPSWVRWQSDDQDTLVDLAAHRIVKTDTSSNTQTNTSLYAEARERLDIYTALSQGGQAETINFGAAGSFDRFWLEAAMGIAASTDELTLDADETGFIGMYKGQLIATALHAPAYNENLDEAPAQAQTCPELAGDMMVMAITLLRHETSLHPAIIEALLAQDQIPCEIMFVVYSPDDPNGRRETWTLLSAPEKSPEKSPESSAEALPEQDPATPAIEDSQPQHQPLPLQQDGPSLTLPGGDDLLGEAGQAAMDAANGAYGPAPDPISFFEDIAVLRTQNDLVGALLVSFVETLHFGPCPSQTVGSVRLACVEGQSLMQAGIGNADFERASEGMAAAKNGDHATALARLEPFLNREDRAGAGARVLIANALIDWGNEGLTLYPHLDPAALLIEAITLDPFASEAYIYLGRRLAAAGAPHTAWVMFDLARALPGREPGPLVGQIETIEARQREIAPHWFLTAHPTPTTNDEITAISLD